jgi:branched-chain amino acid transport system substrate-binding protein
MLNPPFGEGVPGMQKVVDFHKKNHPGDTHDTNYVRGWSYVMVWAEGLKRADKAIALTGEGIRAALETLKDLDLGGLAAPVTYTADDHRGSTKVSLYQVQNGKLVRLSDVEQPRKKEWLGL